MTPIQSLVADLQPRTDALPVVYAGFRPRLLGYAASQQDATLLAVIHRVPMRYTSTARCNFPDGTVSGEFFMLHS